MSTFNRIFLSELDFSEFSFLELTELLKLDFLEFSLLFSQLELWVLEILLWLFKLLSVT